jgi:hypothetical protein
MIVLEGLKGTVPLVELCSRHSITQSQYNIWRDRLLKDGEAIFNFGTLDKEQERLRKENGKLKGIIDLQIARREQLACNADLKK